MDILFSSPQFPQNENQSTLSQLAHRLTDRGHDVSGVYETGAVSTDSFPTNSLSTPSVKSPWWLRLWYYNRVWRRGIDMYLSDGKPDVIIAHQRTHIPTVQSARKHEVPVVAIIEGLGFMRFNPRNNSPDKTPQFAELPIESKIQYPFIRLLFRQQCYAFTEFTAVVALSEFIADVVSSTFEVDSRIIKTMVDINDVRAKETEPEYITMVNPRTKLKGGNIFLEIAETMPSEEFLVAGEFATNAQRQTAVTLDNVTHLGWVRNMCDVYSQTRLLLVPSLVEEGGPRVIVEAFANGIPVVGTNRGGVPEFIHNSGAVVDTAHDINQWIERIETVTDDYDRLSRLARARARQFRTATIVEQYINLLGRIVK